MVFPIDRAIAGWQIEIMSEEPLHHYIPKMILRNFQSLPHPKNGFIYTNDHISKKSLRRPIRITAAIRSLNSWRFNNNTLELSVEKHFGQYENDAAPVLREVISTCRYPLSRTKMKKVIRFYNQLDDRSLPNRRRIFDIIAEDALSDPSSVGVRIEAQSLQGDITFITIVDEQTYQEALGWEWVLLHSHKPTFILTDHSTHHKFLFETHSPYDEHWMILYPLTPYLAFASFSSLIGRSTVCRKLPYIRDVSNTYRVNEELHDFIVGYQMRMMHRYSFTPSPLFRVVEAPDYEENTYDHPMGYKIGCPPSSASRRFNSKGKGFKMPNGNTFVPISSDRSISEAPYGR